MSHFLDRLMFLTEHREPFAGGHGETRKEDRKWEDAYRLRWQHDKIVRSTHGVNCTGGCSWKIYVKGGIVTWETQQTDYPRTRPGMPNHEPRGCSRGASYSWYLYSANRLKHPMVRGRLVRMWREARKTFGPVEAWASIVEDSAKSREYKSIRGRGGFVRATWDEATEIVAAANVYTITKYGPDRICGFSPIPAMSMVSHASGARYLSLIGATLLSFYDWYCDLPPSSPQTWGEQTDVPESADWYNSQFIIAWGSNVPQTRTPDAHFFVEARYNGTRIVSITPDYAEVAKFGDLWLHPKQGTDAALGMAMGHVILKEFHVDRTVPYFDDYARRYTDLPLLVRLAKSGDRYVPDRYLRAADFADKLGQVNSPEWKTVGVDELAGTVVAPQGSIGYRWGPQVEADLGKWNLEQKDGAGARDVQLALSLLARHDDVLPVAFPYFGGTRHEHFPANDQGSDVLVRKVPVKTLRTVDGDVPVATVFDLLCANYGVDRGLGDGCAKSYDDDVPYTPKCGPRVCRDCREDSRPRADHHRRRHEPLVPPGHELPRSDQHGHAVRLRGCAGRRLGALRGTGEAAAANRLAGARVCDRLGAPAAADERDVVLLRALRPVALREDCRSGPAFTACRSGALHRLDDRLQRARGADGLATFGTAARNESATRRPRRGEGRRSAEGIRRERTAGRHAETRVRGSRRSDQLPSQSFSLALEPAWLIRERSRIFPASLYGRATQRPGPGSRRV